MGFYSYEGIPKDVLDKQHTTSTGETYSLRHSESLKVEMSYLGKGNSKANSQGWERDSSKYFEALYKSHPEMFSKKNIERIQEGHAPIVDQKMISSNPNWAQFRNQALVHHHIGGDGEAVAVPQNVHKGQGEIHNHEKSAGITDNCKEFSKKCALNSESFGKTASQMHAKFDAKSNKNDKANMVSPAKNSDSSRISKSTKGTSERSDAVRNNVPSKSNPLQTGRSQTVRDSVHSAGTVSATDRSDSVRNSTKIQGIHSQGSDNSETSQGNGQGGGRLSNGGSSSGQGNGKR